MPAKKSTTTTTTATQLNLLEPELTNTAPCVPYIKQEVEQWRAKGYPGVTATTKRLLNWWFNNDHRNLAGKAFRYHRAQQQAIETVIYLYEVKKIRRRGDLLLTYAKGQKIALPARDDFARYALKMATGSGKTKVMSLAVAWQYFNAVNGEGDGDEYAKTFLVVAPNVIVLERLASDFAGGVVFKADPVIPPDFKMLWDFDVYVRGDSEKMRSEGALYLTNIQQLYPPAAASTSSTATDPASPANSDDNDNQEDAGGSGSASAPAQVNSNPNAYNVNGGINPVADLLGPLPPTTLNPVEGFIERIARRGDCVVLVDEAHHVNDQAVVANSVVTSLHDRLGKHGLTAQLDFSATPRQQDGTLFNWTVYDYPLKQAIIDRVVKRPVKGLAHGITEANSDKASVRYEAYLVAAVERWQEYRSELDKLSKKPILFLMMYDTKSADDVAAWLRTKYPQHFTGDKLLVIHTDTKGEITKSDLDRARQVARQVDDENSPVNCIVSVLMLREGWDVNNVTVVVGLRPFSAKANVLPEQAVGRGLRLMFRDFTGYEEHVDIIGNANFMQVVEELEKEEGIKLDTFDYGKKKSPVVIPTIQVITERIAQYEIVIPHLSARYERKKAVKEVIEGLDIGKVKLKTPLKIDTETVPPDTFIYEGRDVISDAVLFQRTYTLPQAQTSSEVIAYYTQQIVHELKLTAQFALVVPKVKQFLQDKAFGKTVALDNPPVLKALNRASVFDYTRRVFVTLLKPLLTEENKVVTTIDNRLLSTTPPFPWSGKVADVKKTLFNLTPCDNNFEMSFAHFLDQAADVVSFANLGNLPQPLALEYIDNEANLRIYEPDFVALDTDGTYWLVETKGQENLDVARKSARAEQWCEDVTTQTGVNWRYLLVKEKEFNSVKPISFNELVVTATAGGPMFVDME